MKLRKNAGITLIALVVTIIVLLILAGVTLSLALNSNGIFQRSKNAAALYKNAEETEKAELERIGKEMDEVMGILPPLEIPETLKEGDVVTYRPSGEFHWNAELATSYEKDSEAYNSADVDLITVAEDTDEKTINGKQNMSLTEWKVFKIDRENGNVVLMPTSPTTGFSDDFSSKWGNVILGGAQGYNNGVKLLNDACEALYGNLKKGITARSINMEDIETLLESTELNTAKQNITPAYGNRYTVEYSGYRDSEGNYITNRKMPVIYGSENNSIVNGVLNTNGLERSKQNSYISRTEVLKVENNTYTAIKGFIEPISIRPEQTFYYMNEETFANALGIKNSDMVLPKGNLTMYWVASRYTEISDSETEFGLNIVFQGSLVGDNLFKSSNDSGSSIMVGIFPIVTANSGTISGNAENGYTLNAE